MEDLRPLCEALGCARQQVAQALDEAGRVLARMEREAARLWEQTRALREEREGLERERAALRREASVLATCNVNGDDVIELDVGGQALTTSRHTLTCLQGSMLAAWFSGRHALKASSQGRIVIDRDPTWFGYVLDYARAGTMPPLPPDPHVVARIRQEFDFFCIPWPVGGDDAGPSSLVSCMEQGHRELTLLGHTDRVTCLAVDGDTVASGSMDATVRLWDAVGGSCLHTLEGHRGCVLSLALGHGLVASWASEDCTVRLWAQATGSAVHSIACRAVVSLGLGPGMVAASVAEQGQPASLRVWDTATGQALATIPNTNALFRLAFVDGLLAGAVGSSVRLWHPATGACVRSLEGHTMTVDAIVATEGHVVTAAHTMGRPEGEYIVWDPVTGTVRLRRQVQTQYCKRFVYVGGCLAFGDRDHSISLHDMASGGRMDLAGHLDAVLAVAAAPGRRMIVSGSRDKTVKLWWPADQPNKRPRTDE